MKLDSYKLTRIGENCSDRKWEGIEGIYMWKMIFLKKILPSEF